MHITKVEAKNLKGRTFAHDLQPLTLIIGPNFAGKTAIIEAIRLALLSYIPELGKKTSAAFGLSSASRMEVAINLHDGPIPRLERVLWVERGVTRNSCTANSVEWGNALLDASQYFELSDRARIDYVFQRITLPDEFTEAGIVAKLHRVTMDEKHSPYHQTQKIDLVARVEAKFREAAKAGEPLPVAIDEVDALLKDEFTVWNRRARDSEGAVRTLTELKLRESECSAETITDIRNELNSAETLQAEANQEAGALRSRCRESERITRRRDELRAKLEAPAQDYTQVIADLEKQWSSIASPSMPDQQTIRDADVQLNLSLTLARQFREREQEADQALETARAAVEEFDRLTECPTCKGKAKGWKKHVLASLMETVDAATKQLEKMRKERLAAETKHETAAGLMKQINATVEVAREANSKRAMAEVNLNTLRRQAEQEADIRKTTRQEFDSLESIPVPPTDSELAAANKRVADLAAKLTDLRNRMRTAESLAQDIRRGEQANEEHQKAVAFAEITQAIGGALREVRGEIVSVAFDELMAVANDLAGQILPSPLAFKENEIGRYTPSGFVGHGTFSGTEKALTYVAVAAALSAQSPFRLLILDELSRLTHETQEKVLYAFATARREKRIDQVIAVLPLDANEVEAFRGPVDWNILKIAP